MSHHQNLDNKHNTARYFVENRQVSWAVLVGVAVWGLWGYVNMPQRKDPEIPVRDTLAIVRWPGMPAERIEQLATKKVEEALAQNTHVTELRSVTRPGVAYIFAKFDEKLEGTGRELDDLQGKLATLQLPSGVMPVELVKDFGDTATLMLTVASPPADRMDLDLRAREIGQVLRPGRVSVIWPAARTLQSSELSRVTQRIGQWLEESGAGKQIQSLTGSGFAGFDLQTTKSPAEILNRVKQLAITKLQIPELHPDVWEPIAVSDAAQVRSSLEQVAGAKFSYRELDNFTEKIEKALKTLSPVTRVNRSGLLPEQILVQYSQERWGAYGIPADRIQQTLRARSTVAVPAAINAEGRSLPVVPDADFRSTDEIANLLIPAGNGSNVYLRDFAEVERGYETPARFLNYFNYRDTQSKWHRARAVSLDIQMRSGEQIAHFDEVVTAELEKVKQQLPADLILDRTSDQPKQVEEAVELFMGSLWEAIALVVLVSWIGFREWRSALLMALAIPITLAMTFGMAQLLGVDLQQVSIASLIIALGLLVDDPVVAGDAIKRELGAGRPGMFAAWQGPTKLSRAILFATLTNIVAYLPFLLMSGDNRRFLFTLPVVMTCALIASRLVSMTFIPLLGYYLLRPHAEPTLQERRRTGFGALYYRTGLWAIEHRWAVLGVFVVGLLGIGYMASGLKQQFFPFERQYLSFAEIWLPENASITATAETTRKAEQIFKRVAEEYGRGKKHDGERVLRSLTTWVGGGGPRYWLTSNPEPQQPNYAHVLVQVQDKEDTAELLPLWQKALSREIPGATVDVRRLETSAPIGIPIQIRLSGDDVKVLRVEAAKLEQLFRSTKGSSRVRDDWGEDILTAHLNIDEARSAMAGVSPSDVASAASGGLDGTVMGSIRDRDREIPIQLRLRMEERASSSDISNLYVYSQTGQSRVPLSQVASLDYRMQPARIGRYQQFRTITVASFPQEDYLASEVLEAAMPKIQEFEKTLPSGVRMEIAGEFKEQNKGFGELGMVMLVSVLSIYFALVVQFRHAIKPLIVFAAIPFGIVGGLLGLEIMGAPFGFMAFLGVASLVGVIVSHIIVLFDFIEERHEAGEPLVEALLDAGILRLRPVLITVGATVIALIPLASEGGPLWEPLCYVQIGGLTVSTMVTLILVPVVYAIFVRDLKWVKWDEIPAGARATPELVEA
ncbi:MAG: efflux RND transporter permease subunit [Bryobacteraceae bacterium]|nr:efflux RND transporter permease subunit [Bryobacteraceae bacterium]